KGQNFIYLIAKNKQDKELIKKTKDTLRFLKINFRIKKSAQFRVTNFGMSKRFGWKMELKFNFHN
ncbi:hypothetical protein BpHYR1_018960, partial [Brachionus plicatilis]